MPTKSGFLRLAIDLWGGILVVGVLQELFLPVLSFPVFVGLTIIAIGVIDVLYGVAGNYRRTGSGWCAVGRHEYMTVGETKDGDGEPLTEDLKCRRCGFEREKVYI